MILKDHGTGPADFAKARTEDYFEWNNLMVNTIKGL